MWFLLVLAVLVFFYAALAAGAAYLTSRGSRKVDHNAFFRPFISIIVAARNEERALPACLDALLAQDYPVEKIEIIVANDRSTDRTPEVLASYEARDSRLRSVAITETNGAMRGKARALHQAIRSARGEIVLTTDADCTPPPGWASHIAMRFQDSETGMVCGVSLVTHRTLLDRIQALDWALLLAMAAAASEMGRPITAMGNNMAFRRDVYEAVGGYPALPFSVTEDYALLRAVHEKTPWKASLSLDPQIANHTLPLPTLREVFSQRRRWARGGLNAKPWVYVLYFAGFLCHLFLAAGLFFFPIPALVLLLVKLAADFDLLYAVLGKFGERRLLRSFLPFELYLFGYMILMPFSLLLFPRIAWKQQRF